MRGKKLEAWRIPPVWKGLRDNILTAPENSKLLQKQGDLLKITEQTLSEVAKDMREGLLETVGVESRLSIADERCSVILKLPDGTNTAQVAEAIDLENIEAWCDSQKEVHIGISPWFSTKDVDQAVLSAVKVIHVLLGIHAADTAQPQTFAQKLMSSIAEVMQIQKDTPKKND